VTVLAVGWPCACAGHRRGRSPGHGGQGRCSSPVAVVTVTDANTRTPGARSPKRCLVSGSRNEPGTSAVRHDARGDRAGLATGLAGTPPPRLTRAIEVIRRRRTGLAGSAPHGHGRHSGWQVTAPTARPPRSPCWPQNPGRRGCQRRGLRQHRPAGWWRRWPAAIRCSPWSLSSFQLHWAPAVRPAAGALLNNRRGSPGLARRHGGICRRQGPHSDR